MSSVADQASKSSMIRPHLTKDERYPRLFKEAARVLQDVKSKKKSIKTALYSSKLRGSSFKKVYALVYNVLKHMHLIDKIISDIRLLIKEPRISQEAAEIMIYEMAIQKHSLPGQSKPVLIMQNYWKDIEEALSKHPDEENGDGLLGFNADVYSIPRYARIHSLVTTVPEVLKSLKKLGFKQICFDDNIPLSKYYEIVKQLKEYEFLQDIHFSDVLVFPNRQNLSQLSLYEKGHIFLHDKTSYIPVYVLAPPEESIVLDSCAAPGMKTVHLAATMKNLGQIFATDRDENRFFVLKNTLKRGFVKNCKPLCSDFMKINPNAEPYSSVEYILLDPSCSGSGMVNRLDSITDDPESKNVERIQKLARFQIVLLKHALSFPSVKKVVYSTCSINEEENEYVVHEALGHYSDLFSLIPAFPEWPIRGSENFRFGKFCLRASPEKSLTNGFFVAVFERIENVCDQNIVSNENSICPMQYELTITVSEQNAESNFSPRSLESSNTNNKYVESLEVPSKYIKEEKISKNPPASMTVELNEEYNVSKSQHIDDNSMHSEFVSNTTKLYKSKKCKKKRKEKEHDCDAYVSKSGKHKKYSEKKVERINLSKFENSIICNSDTQVNFTSNSSLDLLKHDVSQNENLDSFIVQSCHKKKHKRKEKQKDSSFENISTVHDVSDVQHGDADIVNLEVADKAKLHSIKKRKKFKKNKTQDFETVDLCIENDNVIYDSIATQHDVSDVQHRDVNIVNLEVADKAKLHSLKKHKKFKKNKTQDFETVDICIENDNVIHDSSAIQHADAEITNSQLSNEAELHALKKSKKHKKNKTKDFEMVASNHCFESSHVACDNDMQHTGTKVTNLPLCDEANLYTIKKHKHKKTK